MLASPWYTNTVFPAEGTSTFSVPNLTGGGATSVTTTPGANAQQGTTGTTPMYWTPQAGGVPQVPSLAQTQGQAVSGNLSNLTGIQDLASQTNQFNLGQAANQFAQLPGYTQDLSNIGASIADLTAGKIPTDVLTQLQQAAAERGIATGSPGSPNADAAYLRALGLTSLGLQNQGLTNLKTALGTLPSAPLFNPASFYYTPEQQQAAAQAQSTYNAAPIPAYAQQQAMQATKAGMNRGNQPTTTGQPQSFDIASALLNKYSNPGNAPVTGQAQQATITAPNVGWGEIYDDQGNYYTTGNITAGSGMFDDLLMATGTGDYYPE